MSALGLLLLFVLAVPLTLWQMRIGREIEVVSPQAHTELRFDRVGSWLPWNVARARNAFRSQVVAHLPAELLRAVRLYVLAEVAYLVAFGIAFVHLAAG